MMRKILTISLAFLCGSIMYCDACSCMFEHPQTQYCNSDFVIVARVIKEQVMPSTGLKTYKVRIRKEFKISEKGIVALKSGRIHTPMYGSMCGISLQVGKLYVITGRINSLKAHVNLCNMVMEWKDVSKRQRKGFRLLYKHGCTCSIRNCMFYDRCYRQKDSCNWKSPCETTEGICLRQGNGSCMWTKNKMLATCRQHLKNTTHLTHRKLTPRVPVYDIIP